MDFSRLCTNCRHMTPLFGGPGCVMQRHAVDGTPILAGVRRMFGSQDCGPDGKEWQARKTLCPDIAAVLADPAASYWLKAAIATATARDPVDAVNDADALLSLLEVWEEGRLAESLPRRQEHG